MDDSKYTYEFYDNIAKHLLTRTQYRPKLGIVCGSGLGTLAKSVESSNVLSYESIPEFPLSTAPGHAGNLVFGMLKGKQVILMQGRFHPYEGYSTKKATIPIRVMHLMGVETILFTGAAGSINPAYNVGDFVLIKDHISIPNLAGLGPLVGHNEPKFGPRFPALSDAYDKKLLELGRRVAAELKITDTVHEGVYFNQMGPCYETVAENRMIKILGGDVVAMSIGHETAVARHVGIRILAIALVTNKGILEYDSAEKANHEEVLETADLRAEAIQTFVKEIVAQMDNV